MRAKIDTTTGRPGRRDLEALGAARELAAMMGGAGLVSEEQAADYAAVADLDADALWDAVTRLREGGGDA